MKNKLRVLSVLLIAATLASLLCSGAFAQSDSSKMVAPLEDGSYFVIEITENDSGAVKTNSSVKTKSGTKTYEYYSASNELLWVFRVHGTFTYDGTSAEATYADYSYQINHSDWSFVSGSASCSDATATATGKFRHGLIPVTASASLTCSKDGQLS